MKSANRNDQAKFSQSTRIRPNVWGPPAALSRPPMQPIGLCLTNVSLHTTCVATANSFVIFGDHRTAATTVLVYFVNHLLLFSLCRFGFLHSWNSIFFSSLLKVLRLTYTILLPDFKSQWYQFIHQPHCCSPQFESSFNNFDLVTCINFIPTTFSFLDNLTSL